MLIEREKKGVDALDSSEVFLYCFKTKEDLNGRINEGKKEISVYLNGSINEGKKV